MSGNIEWQKAGRHAYWVVTVQQTPILQQHSTSRHVWTVEVFVTVTLGQHAYMLQLQRHSNSQHSMYFVLTMWQSWLIQFHSVSWHVWWRGIGQIAFLFDFQWTRRRIWLNSTKFAGISVQVSLTSDHVMPPAHHIWHPYRHACLILWYWTSTHAI